MSTSETSEIGSTTSSGTPRYYYFCTKPGTSVSTFEEFIKTLPDEGKGAQMVIPTLKRQFYQTKLTFPQATEVAKQPFIRYIEPVIALKDADNPESDSSGSSNSRL